jgi:hypothetical protein
LSPPSTDSPLIKDERWVIKTFRPLLQSLKVQAMPPPQEMTIVYLADKRDWIIKGMGRCIVVIEQCALPDEVGGMLITSHDTDLDYFRLHIVINISLCNKINLDDRARQKITAVHEFTHTVAALSALSRVRSKDLVKRLKDIFKKKTHAIYLTDIEQLVQELNTSLPVAKPIKSKKDAKKEYFPDEHFRLGFEDFPISYPIIFNEFLFSREMFEEYFSEEIITLICEAFQKKDSKALSNLILPLTNQISQEKALYKDFVLERVFNILSSDYI